MHNSLQRKVEPMRSDVIAQKPASIAGFALVTILRTKVTLQNYESACPWDICSLCVADEKVKSQKQWPAKT
jgi:hypothetical protein